MTELSKRANSLLGEPNLEKYSGADRAFLFLVSIDESVATKIIGHLRNEDVELLRSASTTLDEVAPSTLIGVYREFIREIKDGVPTSLEGSGAYLRRLTGKAFGEGTAAQIWEGQREVVGPVAELSSLDVATVLPLLEREHPQTLAVIFSLMDPARAGDLIGHFDSTTQSEVVRRIATLKKVPDSVVRQIEEQFAAELATLGDIRHIEVDGIEAAAALLRRLDSEKSEELIDELSLVDQAAAERVRRAMFTFENLLRVDTRGMQQLLKEVATDQLVLSLKTASDDMKEKIFASVSSRAAATIADELDLLGPVKLSDVEEAQQAIVAVAMQLEKDGRLQIARDGGGDLV
jgi:flagellar motor switch protein FliG